MEKDTSTHISQLKVDGGATRDKFLMQFQADIMGASLRRPVVRETTALGAAYLAGIAMGFWKGINEVRDFWQCDATFEPEMDEAQRKDLVTGWRKAVGRSLDWEEK
jgi:glycerol kinase